jgi:hypothetical protein
MLSVLGVALDAGGVVELAMGSPDVNGSSGYRNNKRLGTGA